MSETAEPTLGDRAAARALAILARHGYGPGDLDFLIFEGQAGVPGDDDPELEDAIGVLASLRERSRPLR